MRVSGWLFLLQQTIGSLVLLYAACRWMHIRPPHMRLAAASLLCSAASLAACISEKALPALAAILCMMLAPRLSGVRLPHASYFRAAMLLLFLACFCTGVLRALSGFIMPPLLPLCAAFLLLLPALDRRLPAASCASVTIAVAGKRVHLTALLDSGNLLRDPLTALPVIVCSRRALAPLDPMRRRLRLLSVRTAAGSALMPVFRADSVRLLSGGSWRNVNALIGVAPEGYDGFQALIPASLGAGQPPSSAALPS